MYEPNASGLVPGTMIKLMDLQPIRPTKNAINNSSAAQENTSMEP